MNPVLKKVVISIGLNLLLAAALCIPFAFDLSTNNSIGWLLVLAGVGIVSLAIQLIVGIIFLFNPQKKETGQAILIVTGLFLLIGFVTCSGIW